MMPLLQPEEIRIDINYEIKLINEKYVSFVIAKTETLASAYNTLYFYNIDIENGRFLTLRDYLGPNYMKRL